jgi:fatty acid CoA ligase FadD9
MSTSSGDLETRIARRIDELYDTDREFAAAKPDQSTSEAICQPGLRLAELMQIVVDRYSDRPALRQRAVEFVVDPAKGRTVATLQARYDTLTYRQLWQRVTATTAALSADRDGPVAPSDRVCLLGFSSVDYTTIDMALVLLGAVSVPLQTSAPASLLGPIVAETEPVVIASDVDSLAVATEIISGHRPARLVVFDYHDQVDAHRAAVDAARATLVESGAGTTVEVLPALIARGEQLPATPAHVSADTDPLALIIYTSGSTGTPKGAMYPERLVANSWRSTASATWTQTIPLPSITLNFLPMSHGMGRGILYGTLGVGGTAYFASRSDLSTVLDDMALVAPTALMCVPRVWDMLYHELGVDAEQNVPQRADDPKEVAEIAVGPARRMLGRCVSASTGSAPLSPEIRQWVENLLDVTMGDGYGTTESGGILVNGHICRPAVTEYKLIDVPDLGYYHTDQPYPRGELIVKSADMFAGYFNRPELNDEMFDEDGFYHTGDIMAQVGPDQLQYLDRRNNVLKLAQGEFVTVSALEVVFGESPVVQQIYVYGNSARPYLLSVVVPTEDALADAGDDLEGLKARIGESLQRAARDARLQPYEIPRDFIVEPEPFTLENGLLTGVRKLAWPKLKAKYGERLEELYAELAAGQTNELQELREHGADQPTLETVCRAAGALLGASASELTPTAHFVDLGGDSLSALTFGNLLTDIYEVDVPVSIVTSPASDLAAIAGYIDAERAGGDRRPTFASVHGRGATEVRADDIKLDKFIDGATLTGAATLPGPEPDVRTVLLTGATGFLGRYLALEWLERMSLIDGKVICVVRAKDNAAAQTRLDRFSEIGDPELLRHYQRLGERHLEVLAGDKGEVNLGLDAATWRRLAETVDVIVDPAALVNHVLPYSQLFGPNVAGTAELIKMAITSKLKPIIHVSTIGVGDQISPEQFVEDADIRDVSPVRKVDDSNANGYANSKWGGEVLLREAHDLCGLPVAVFRCDMILAEPRWAGQLNLPDVFTRLMFSLVATGIAPPSFCELSPDGSTQPSHYDGLPVDFVAEAVSTLGERIGDRYQTYHALNPHDDGIGMDTFVDWLVESGRPIRRLNDYSEWLRRFETAMRGLPEDRRQQSVLPLLRNFGRPGKPEHGPMAPVEVFRHEVQDAKLGADADIPHVTRPVIIKYADDLELLGLL